MSETSEKVKVSEKSMEIVANNIKKMMLKRDAERTKSEYNLVIRTIANEIWERDSTVKVDLID